MEHNKKLTSRAQKLRKNMTKEERRLWYEYLRGYKNQFRRQVTFGNYILDFIVPLQSWLLNWMVHSIMRRQGKTMMNPEQHI